MVDSSVYAWNSCIGYQGGINMSTVLEVQDLCKTYVVNKRQNNVLRNVNLKVEEGEMVAVMGPSGSGKSTLLYSVSGMDQPTAGKSIFLGEDLTQMSPKKLAQIRLDSMGFIFQQMYMLKNLSVLDNIVLPSFQSETNTASRKEKREYAQELMRKMGIIDIADNDISEVSGGQLQRACICRSMVNHPKLIFADEPTGSLNRTSSEDVMDELSRLNQLGTTMLFVTHDVRVAAKCSRVIYIVDGGIAGEYNLGQYDDKAQIRQREKDLNHWLLDMGW